jgi:hypothetical protein
MVFDIKNIIKICLNCFCLVSCVYPVCAEEIDTHISVQDLRVNQWQQKTLMDLIKRYKCSVTNNYHNLVRERWEFALHLKKCLEDIDNLNLEDIQTIERLQEDFSVELQHLTQKTADLETKVTQLERKQFAVTTKLTGEVIYQLADSFSKQDQSQPFLGYRSRINFNTSFTGQDLLKIRLEAIDIGRLDRVTDTVLTRLGTDGSSEGKFEVEMAYEFFWDDRTQIIISPKGISLNDVADVLNPLSSSSRGALSRFGRRDPATLRTPGGSGVGVKYELSENLRLNLAYVVASNDAPNPQIGLFGASYSTIIQLVINPNDDLALALSYTHAYESEGEVDLMESTGSEIANQPFGKEATSSDRLGLQFNWGVTDNVELGGWVGAAQAYQESDGNDQATILNGAFTLAFKDLWRENNLGGIIIGVPPLVSNHSDKHLIADFTTLHLEVFYRIQLENHLEITPGLFVLINPDTPSGDTIWVGTIRTRFHF